MDRLRGIAKTAGDQAAVLPPRSRAVIVTGVRTPFTRAFGEQLSLDTIALGTAAVKGLVEKTKLDAQEIDHLVWGGVMLVSGSPNTAREIIIDAKLPPHIAAHTESMACASGLKSVLSAVQMIESGNASVVVAGGSDSTSNGEMPLARHIAQSLALYSFGKIGLGKFLSVAGPPCAWMPPRPSVAERSTGKTMGYHADVMAGLCGVTREQQDAFAIASHQKAAKAIKENRFREEVIAVTTQKSALSEKRIVTRDSLVRGKSDPKKAASLSTVFRKKEEGGTVTAANASPLTDGAAACLIMSAEKAKALGYAADVAVRSWAASGINPQPNLLLAPALAIPVALQRAGLKLSDIDYFEIHEAFAGQVLATINVLASDDLSKKYLNLPSAVGQIPADKVNIYGGSVSIGHPFGATGARLTTNATRILRDNQGARYVLVSICAAGGLGLVTIFEKI